MQTLLSRLGMLVIAGVLTVGLVGCSDEPSDAEDALGNMGRQLDRAADEAGDAAEDAARDAEDAADDAANAINDAMGN